MIKLSFTLPWKYSMNHQGWPDCAYQQLILQLFRHFQLASTRLQLLPSRSFIVLVATCRIIFSLVSDQKRIFKWRFNQIPKNIYVLLWIRYCNICIQFNVFARYYRWIRNGILNWKYEFKWCKLCAAYHMTCLYEHTYKF